MVGEELGPPGWGLLQQEMEEAPARERSKEVKAGSCHPCCVAGRPGTDRREREEEGEEAAAMGRGLSVRGIYDRRH